MIEATPEQVRQATQDVLARPEFSDRPTLTQLLMDRIFQWLERLVRWSAQNPDLARILIIVLTVLLLLLLVHIVYTVLRELTTLRKPDRARARRPVRALEGVAQNWSEAFQFARAALEAGDLYRALWITHRVLLSVLDRMGRIKFVRWKTNSDYLHECRSAGHAGTTLTELTDAYERVVYAHTELDRLEAVKLLAEVEALAAEAGR